MKTLLVPIDFSDATPSVLAAAEKLARLAAARLILLHVTEPVPSYVPVGGALDVLAAVPPPLETESISAQEEHLAALAQGIRAGGLEVETAAILGLAADDILQQAKKCAADYIVLGSHGRGALYHLFSGSVVNAVLKHADCPVLVVPIPHADLKSKV